MKNRYCNPETALYELDNEYYTLADLARFAERHERMELIRRNACCALCGIHLMGFMAGIIFLNVVTNWLLLLLGIMYCLAGTILFGLMAGGESNDSYCNEET